MGLEVTTYISGLVTTNPTAGDPRSEGDDHLRLIKSTLKTTFPNITGAVTASHTSLNRFTGIPANGQILTRDATTGEIGTAFGYKANSYGNASTYNFDLSLFNIYALTRSSGTATTINLTGATLAGRHAWIVARNTSGVNHPLTWTGLGGSPVYLPDSTKVNTLLASGTTEASVYLIQVTPINTLIQVFDRTGY